MTLALIGFVAVLVLAFIGVPLAFSMILIGTAGFAVLRGLDPAMTMLAQQVVDVSSNYGLSVLPMFILMGLFIFKADISEELYDAANAWLGHLKGGLAHATVLACGLFGAISGSSIAASATMSKVAIPPMRRSGYHDAISTGSIASGGVLAAVIPPSVPLIVYGLLTETDIKKLFLGTLFPGLILVLLFMLAIVITIGLRPKLGPQGQLSSMSERLRKTSKLWSVFVLLLLVMGGMYGGLFTVTESAGIGAMGALAIGVVRRRLAIKDIINCMMEATKITTMIFVILFGALTFANFVNLSGMTFELVMLIEDLGLSRVGVLIAIALIYLVMGCVMESMGLLILTAPIFLAVVQNLGVDPIWFGIFVVMMIEIGMLTPPVGMNVFTVKAINPDIPLTTIFAGTAPFLAACIVIIGLIIAWPDLVMAPTTWVR
jgi:C4-dicarboxylate transporter DctM subunit